MLVTTIFFAFDKGVDEGVGVVVYVRKLNNVAPELLPIVGAVLGDVTIVHDVVGLVNGHAFGNAGPLEGLHGHDIGVVVARVRGLFAHGILAATVEPSGLVRDLEIVAGGRSGGTSALEQFHSHGDRCWRVAVQRQDFDLGDNSFAGVYVSEQLLDFFIGKVGREDLLGIWDLQLFASGGQLGRRCGGVQDNPTAVGFA